MSERLESAGVVVFVLYCVGKLAAWVFGSR